MFLGNVHHNGLLVDDVARLRATDDQQGVDYTRQEDQARQH